MNDGELRELCHRFFDAIERHDLDRVAALYAPGFSIWANVSGAEKTREENIQLLAEGKGRHRRRTYDDRTINTFDEGFVIQYTLSGIHHTGHRGALSACIVGLCRNGKITRIIGVRAQGDGQHLAFGGAGRGPTPPARRTRW
jgi:ketosteroid isomerase-like protein